MFLFYFIDNIYFITIFVSLNKNKYSFQNDNKIISKLYIFAPILIAIQKSKSRFN